MWRRGAADQRTGCVGWRVGWRSSGNLFLWSGPHTFPRFPKCASNPVPSFACSLDLLHARAFRSPGYVLVVPHSPRLRRSQCKSTSGSAGMSMKKVRNDQKKRRDGGNREKVPLSLSSLPLFLTLNLHSHPLPLIPSTPTPDVHGRHEGHRPEAGGGAEEGVHQAVQQDCVRQGPRGPSENSALGLR